MRALLLGLLLGTLVAFPALFAQLWFVATTATVWAVGQPLVVAFAAGLLARPRLARRFGGAR